MVFVVCGKNADFLLFSMPKTKAQKKEIVENNLDVLKTSESVVFADFTGLKVNDLNVLRRSLKEKNARFSVIKKRLLGIVFGKNETAFEAKKMDGQVGVIFSKTDLVQTAGAAYQFSAKQKENFKILGGYDAKDKKFFDGEYVKMIGQLPSREALLGQLVGMVASPIRSFLYILNERSKQRVEN